MLEMSFYIHVQNSKQEYPRVLIGEFSVGFYSGK